MNRNYFLFMSVLFSTLFGSLQSAMGQANKYLLRDTWISARDLKLDLDESYWGDAFAKFKSMGGERFVVNPQDSLRKIAVKNSRDEFVFSEDATKTHDQKIAKKVLLFLETNKKIRHFQLDRIYLHRSLTQFGMTKDLSIDRCYIGQLPSETDESYDYFLYAIPNKSLETDICKFANSNEKASLFVVQSAKLQIKGKPTRSIAVNRYLGLLKLAELHRVQLFLGVPDYPNKTEFKSKVQSGETEITEAYFVSRHGVLENQEGINAYFNFLKYVIYPNWRDFGFYNQTFSIYFAGIYQKFEMNLTQNRSDIIKHYDRSAKLFKLHFPGKEYYISPWWVTQTDYVKDQYKSFKLSTDQEIRRKLLALIDANIKQLLESSVDYVVIQDGRGVRFNHNHYPYQLDYDIRITTPDIFQRQTRIPMNKNSWKIKDNYLFSLAELFQYVQKIKIDKKSNKYIGANIESFDGVCNGRYLPSSHKLTMDRAITHYGKYVDGFASYAWEILDLEKDVEITYSNKGVKCSPAKKIDTNHSTIQLNLANQILADGLRPIIFDAAIKQIGSQLFIEVMGHNLTIDTKIQLTWYDSDWNEVRQTVTVGKNHIVSTASKFNYETVTTVQVPLSELKDRTARFWIHLTAENSNGKTNERYSFSYNK